ncbi:MAG TPA: hypothetical protein VL995_14635 [Cellvibrio sp.]|nr:hypothetical protein [Cellvibrio sp.]
MKILVKILVFISVITALFFIWLTKPYMDYQSLRKAGTPQKVVAEYKLMTGDVLCTKLYRVDDGSAIYPNVPDDLPDPNEIDSLKEGDRITIVAYMYEWQAKNLVTGNIEKKPTGMMDVIAWSDEDSLNFRSNLKNPQADQFKRKNYSDCN